MSSSELKYKVGDRIRVVEDDANTHTGREGIVRRLDELDRYPYVIELDNGSMSGFCDRELELLVRLQPAEPAIETLPNGAKQSKLESWWNLPYGMLAVSRVMGEGHAKYDPPGTTPSQGNWHSIPIWSHIQHAVTHLFLYATGDTTEDHLAHAAARVLMALDQRESGRERHGQTVSRSDNPQQPNR